MREVVHIPFADLRVKPKAVLAQQGVPDRALVEPRIADLLHQALDYLTRDAAPAGVFSAIPGDRFGEVYAGEGRNAGETPLSDIYPRAHRLALFAVTLGETVSARIRTLFEAHEFALATMLDAAASEATESAGDALERHYLGLLRQVGDADARTRVLRYSPGYCGWHVSGQRRLFGCLRPEEIGITLRPSFLMEPLKSMSGVIVAGPGEIHEFDNDFDFCARCRDWECRERIERVLTPDRSEERGSLREDFQQPSGW